MSKKKKIILIDKELDALILKGDIGGVRNYFRHGFKSEAKCAAVNALNSEGDRPLHTAAKIGSLSK